MNCASVQFILLPKQSCCSFWWLSLSKPPPVSEREKAYGREKDKRKARDTGIRSVDGCYDYNIEHCGAHSAGVAGDLFRAAQPCRILGNGDARPRAVEFLGQLYYGIHCGNRERSDGHHRCMGASAPHAYRKLPHQPAVSSTDRYRSWSGSGSCSRSCSAPVLRTLRVHDPYRHASAYGLQLRLLFRRNAGQVHGTNLYIHIHNHCNLGTARLQFRTLVKKTVSSPRAIPGRLRYLCRRYHTESIA